MALSARRSVPGKRGAKLFRSNYGPSLLSFIKVFTRTLFFASCFIEYRWRRWCCLNTKPVALYHISQRQNGNSNEKQFLRLCVFVCLCVYLRLRVCLCACVLLQPYISWYIEVFIEVKQVRNFCEVRLNIVIMAHLYRLNTIQRASWFFFIRIHVALSSTMDRTGDREEKNN